MWLGTLQEAVQMLSALPEVRAWVQQQQRQCGWSVNMVRGLNSGETNPFFGSWTAESQEAHRMLCNASLCLRCMVHVLHGPR